MNLFKSTKNLHKSLLQRDKPQRTKYKKIRNGLFSFKGR